MRLKPLRTDGIEGCRWIRQQRPLAGLSGCGPQTSSPVAVPELQELGSISSENLPVVLAPQHRHTCTFLVTERGSSRRFRRLGEVAQIAAWIGVPSACAERQMARRK